jgi:hypothetical protein
VTSAWGVIGDIPACSGLHQLVMRSLPSLKLDLGPEFYRTNAATGNSRWRKMPQTVRMRMGKCRLLPAKGIMSASAGFAWISPEQISLPSRKTCRCDETLCVKARQILRFYTETAANDMEKLSFAINSGPAGPIDCNGQRVSSRGTEHDKDCDNHEKGIVCRCFLFFGRKALMSGYVTDQLMGTVPRPEGIGIIGRSSASAIQYSRSRPLPVSHRERGRQSRESSKFQANIPGFMFTLSTASRA